MPITVRTLGSIGAYTRVAWSGDFAESLTADVSENPHTGGQAADGQLFLSAKSAVHCFGANGSCDAASLRSRSCLSIALCGELRDDDCMSTVAELKEAIARLSPQEYCELMAELVPQTDDDWDKQMKADAEAGRLDFIDRDVKKAAREGTLVPLERMLAEDEPDE